MLFSIPQAHSEVLISLQFSPSHHFVFCSTSGDDTAALWDLRQATCNHEIVRMVHHQRPVNHSLFLHDNEQALLTASDDRTVAWWDLRKLSRPVGVIRGFRGEVNKMLRIPTASLNSAAGALLLASACDDGMVYIHSIGVGCVSLPHQEQEQGTGVISNVNMHNIYGNSYINNSNSNGNGNNNDSGTYNDNSIPFIGTMVDSFWAATSTVNDIVLSPNPNMFITASEDCVVRVWNILLDHTATTEARLVASFDEFEDPVNHISVAHTTNDIYAEGTQSAFDTCWLYAACSEFLFAVDFYPATGAFGEGARTFRGHQDYIRGVEFTSDSTLLTVSDDSTAIEWSLATAEPIRQLKLHEGLIMSSAISAAKDVLVTGTDGGELRGWRLPFETETCSGVATY